MVFIDSTLSTMAHLSSPAISSINDCITDVVGARLHGTIQETVMDTMAKMAYKYFPKNPPSIVNNTLDISEIFIPPSQLMKLRSFLNKPGAHFSCPEQAILLEMMISWHHSILAVLGTGSRKTDTLSGKASKEPANSHRPSSLQSAQGSQKESL